MAKITLAKPYEEIWFEDLEDNPERPVFRIDFTDKSITDLMKKIMAAAARVAYISKIDQSKATEKDLDKALHETVQFQRRVISAFIGKKGYNYIVDLLSDGEEKIDPEDHVIMFNRIISEFFDMLSKRVKGGKLDKVSKEERDKMVDFLAAYGKGSKL